MMKRVFFAAGLAAVVAAHAFSGGTASALDITDVKTLVANNVDEAVVLSMVQSEGALSATAGDVDELRALGASEAVVSAVQNAANSVASAPGEYILEDGSTVVIPQTTTPAPPGTVYYAAPAAPQTVYVTPPPVYVTPYPRYPVYRRPRAGVTFSFGFDDRPRYRDRWDRWDRRRWR